MAIVQHQSNRADVKDIFTNDFSSKNAVEQERRKQQEAAAHAKTKEAEAKRLEAERVAKEEAIAKKLNEYMEEIETLKVERKEYTAEIETLKTERKDLNSKTEAKRAELEAKRVELETNVKNESEKARRLGTQLEQANTKIFSLENAEKERESAELDPGNNLPLEWHGKVVTFINTCGKTAIDMGNSMSSNHCSLFVSMLRA